MAIGVLKVWWMLPQRTLVLLVRPEAVHLPVFETRGISELYVKQYRFLPIKMKRVVRSSCGSLFLLRHEPEVPLVREWTGVDGSEVERPARSGGCVTQRTL